MISLEDFSELLAVLYSAPLQPERWQHFLDLLCKHTGSRSSFLICAESGRSLSIRANGGVPHDPAVIEKYAAEYSGRDPYMLPLIRSGRTGVIDCNELLPREALVESDMYLHLNYPAGYRYPGLVTMTCTLNRFECISFWRSEEEGYLSADANRLLEMLVPHLQAAMEIRHALGIADQRATGAEQIADASPTPSFLLGDIDEILHANRAARQMLEEGDGLCDNRGLLAAAKGAMRKPLRAFLQGMRADAARFRAHKAFALERKSLRRPLQLLASPAPSYSPGAVLLLATDPEKPVVLRDDVLRSHFRLTEAETEVANGLLTGFSLEEIAAFRNVSIGTVRGHIKSILSKTGTGRQAELVRLLLSLPRLEDLNELPQAQ